MSQRYPDHRSPLVVDAHGGVLLIGGISVFDDQMVVGFDTYANTADFHGGLAWSDAGTRDDLPASALIQGF